MSASAADDTLSAECTVARRPEYADMHDRCRQLEDIPVHHSTPRILLQLRCRCTCHWRKAAVDAPTEEDRS